MYVRTVHVHMNSASILTWKYFPKSFSFLAAAELLPSAEFLIALAISDANSTSSVDAVLLLIDVVDVECLVFAFMVQVSALCEGTCVESWTGCACASDLRKPWNKRALKPIFAGLLAG